MSKTKAITSTNTQTIKRNITSLQDDIKKNNGLFNYQGSTGTIFEMIYTLVWPHNIIGVTTNDKDTNNFKPLPSTVETRPALCKI